MANNGGDWNSFMQSKPVQMVLYSACVVFCVFYAVGGIMEMMSPDRSTGLVQALGEGGYYALIIVRTIVLLITAVAFARIAIKTYREK